MSYSIIFQDKVVNLGNGKIVYFFRVGCNNDNCGRLKGEFRGNVYTVDEFTKMARNHMEDSKPYKDGGEFDLKIRSRTASMYDYGKHLLTMLRRAESITSFQSDYYFFAKQYKGFSVLSPFEKTYMVDEYPDAGSDRFYRRGDFEGIIVPIQYRNIYDMFFELKDCVDLIEENKPLQFYINRRH